MTFAFDLRHRHGLPLPELKALVGGKAANLKVMATELDLPVPPGFVVTTLTCRSFLATGWPDGLDRELRERMAGVEAAVGRRFGDPSDPLLVSVRSGAPVSMPGMMDTILNLGLNEATAAGLARATGDEAFAADCRRRFVDCFRSIVGVDQVPDDPWQQLRAAIEAVFRSWTSERARAYRAKEGIADDLGTAVTVQAMVFGNRGAESATGVLFTRNPATGEAVPYGDILFDAQGEDVVAGTHRTEPIAVLDERLPAVGAELRDYAARLEHQYRDLCDIEFTIERGRLWMLQVRVGKRSPGAALRIALDMANDPGFPLSRPEAVERTAAILADPPTTMTRPALAPPPLTTGLPASPGVASGEIALSPEAAVAAADAGRTVILVRAETSPDDVPGMARSAGVLTSRGGLASHAAVVARGWGIPAVVGATDVRIDGEHVDIGTRGFDPGDVITVDGGTGEVFAGAVGGVRSMVPEATTLLAWAAELGIPIAASGGASVAAASTAAALAPVAAALAPVAGAEPSLPTPVATRTLTRDDVLRALGIKGFATVETLADALLSTADAVAPLIGELVAERLAENGAGALKLTADGKLAVTGLIAADTAGWGEDAAGEALDTFHGFDLRMKETVTAWQMREVAGDPAINDHTDAAYDAAVLDRLGALHADTIGWLGGITEHCGRFDDYRARLERALARARAGDQRYVASPRVDSYHGAWFELHEELIRLAGRRRSDEALAGRA
jgi:pyruvate,orthophosphate dikinase